MDKYYKDSLNNLFVNPDLSRYEFTLTEISKDEFTEQLAENKNASLSKESLKDYVDLAANRARLRFIAKGETVVEEYRLAAQQTASWRDAGSPAESVPSAISSWATASGMTDEEAAANIETTLVGFESVLLNIRSIRLSGKSAIDSAPTLEAKDVAQGFIDQLDAITP